MNRLGFGIVSPFSGSFEEDVLSLSMENYIPKIEDFLFTIGEHPDIVEIDTHPTVIKECFTGTELKQVLEKNGFKITIEKL